MTTTATCFSFIACRRIARHFGLSYIPKYRAGDVLSKPFVEELARKHYARCNDLSRKTDHLAKLLFSTYYNEGLLALEVFVCSMVPQDVPPSPAVIEPVVEHIHCPFSDKAVGCTQPDGADDSCPEGFTAGKCWKPGTKALDNSGVGGV